MGAIREWVEKFWGRPSGERPATVEQAAVDFLAHVRPFDASRSRAHSRYPCRLPLSLIFGTSRVVGLACDISTTGLGLRTTMPVAPGTRVLVRFGAAGDYVHVPATVVWTRADGRVAAAGMRFDNGTDVRTDLVQALVRRVSAGLEFKER